MPFSFFFGDRKIAPAASESIHLKNSVSKARMGRFFKSGSPGRCSKKWERSSEDASSDPVATAFSENPRATLAYAAFKEVMPQRQIPDVVTASKGPIFNSPATISACPGKSTSGVEVPAQRHSMSLTENSG